jgi:hypothetical protein
MLADLIVVAGRCINYAKQQWYLIQIHLQSNLGIEAGCHYGLIIDNTTEATYWSNKAIVVTSK